MGQVQSKLRLLLERRNCIKQLSTKRRDELATSRLLCVFNRNATEVHQIPPAHAFSCDRGGHGSCSSLFLLGLQAEEWIWDRMQKLQEDCKRDLSDLHMKLKLLQKHQVFEAEILAHHQIIGAVQQVRCPGGPSADIMESVSAVFND